VLPSVSRPQYGWGSVTYSSVGTVTYLSSSGNTATVDFPEQSGWAAAVAELLVVCASGSGSSSGCSAGSYVDGSSASCRSCPAGERARSSAEDVLWMCLFEYREHAAMMPCLALSFDVCVSSLI
jgi:hypothetical protein